MVEDVDLLMGGVAVVVGVEGGGTEAWGEVVGGGEAGVEDHILPGVVFQTDGQADGPVVEALARRRGTVGGVEHQLVVLGGDDIVELHPGGAGVDIEVPGPMVADGEVVHVTDLDGLTCFVAVKTAVCFFCHIREIF